MKQPQGQKLSFPCGASITEQGRVSPCCQPSSVMQRVAAGALITVQASSHLCDLPEGLHTFFEIGSLRVSQLLPRLFCSTFWFFFFFSLSRSPQSVQQQQIIQQIPILELNFSHLVRYTPYIKTEDGEITGHDWKRLMKKIIRLWFHQMLVMHSVFLCWALTLLECW